MAAGISRPREAGGTTCRSFVNARPGLKRGPPENGIISYLLLGQPYKTAGEFIDGVFLLAAAGFAAGQ